MKTSSHTHTPGPWKIHNNIGRKSELGIVAAAAPCVIVTMHGAKAGEWPGIAKANARLIAAAPDLLAALESALATDSTYVAWEKKARAAIAKAKGTV